MPERVLDAVQIHARIGQPRTSRPAQVVQPHVGHAGRFADAAPRLVDVDEGPPMLRARKDVRVVR